MGVCKARQDLGICSTRDQKPLEDFKEKNVMQFKDVKLLVLNKEWIVMERGGWARQTLEEITAMVQVRDGDG